MWHRFISIGALVVSAAVAVGQSDCDPVDTLVLTDTWQTVSGSYAEGGSLTYQVTMDLGVNYIFKTGCGDGATADHDTRIEWLAPTAPTCTVIMQDDDGCGQGRSELNFNSFFSDGTVLRVRVSGAQGAGGSFTMAYRSVNGVPAGCNDCPSFDEDLSPSSLWQTVNGSYAALGCRIYRIIGTPGLEYTFKTGCGDGATADQNTDLQLFKEGWPSCTLLTSDDDGCELGRSKITWTPAQGNSSMFLKVNAPDGMAGNFTLAYRASGGNGSVCGSCTDYDLSITPNANWLHHSSSYLADGCQVYRVAVDAGYTYTFKTGCGDGATSDHDTYLELFNDTCGLLAWNENGCDSSASILSYVADASGFRYLRVSGVGNEEGFYTLAARKSGICAECPAYDAQITPGLAWQTDTGSYWAYGCHIYQVHVTAGHTYVFQTAYGHGATADHALNLDLLNAGCEPLSVNGPWPGYAGGRRFYMAGSTGAIFLKVHGVGNAHGGYTLAYRDIGAAADACADAIPIELGEEASIQLAGTLQDATATSDFDPASPWAGLPVKWYALDVSEDCYSVTVDYCGQDPVWLNTLNILTDSCGAGEGWTGGSSPWGACNDGNARYVFYAGPGLHYLPLLYDPANSVDGGYSIQVSCSNIIVDAIEEHAPSAWTVQPNPGRDGLWLRSQQARRLEPTHAHVVDLLGRTVLQTVITSTPVWIDMNHVPNGIYMVQIQDAQGSSTLRWIKE